MNKKNIGRIIGIGFVAVVTFILASIATYRIGFPLDDAWIHQTYARNLAQHGEFAFLPGVPSAGSTSPLWTVLLVPGQWLGSAGIYLWAYFLGFVSLAILGIVGEKLFRSMVHPDKNAESLTMVGKLPLVGLLLVSEWHLVWAAASGMETVLYSMVILLVLFLAWQNRAPAFWLGMLIGVTIWIRPDGITLLGPVGMMLFFQFNSWTKRAKALGLLVCGMLIPLAGYLVFNYSLSGHFWPSTFYAKQAEYAALWKTGFLSRFFQLASLPLVGVGVLLLPGFLYQFLNIVRQRNWKLAAMMLWWVGYTGIYAYRLPVSYQHGRYLIPAMPVFFLLGLSGTIAFFEALRLKGRWKRRVEFGAKAVAILVTLAFLVSGARAYATDVAIIESEMVNTARWLHENTAEEDLLAVHDIGAIGYFSQRTIIDLAGLASPEVIPFIRDEVELATYMDSRGVAYLVTFPDWYHDLPQGKCIVYETDGVFSLTAGGTSMTVYRWNDEK